MLLRNQFRFLRCLTTIASQRNPVKHSRTTSIIPHDDFEVELKNEPILSYETGSTELQKLKEALEKFQTNIEDIPIVIGGKEIKTDNVRYQVIPHRHNQQLAKYYHADQNLLHQAIRTAVEMNYTWDRVDVKQRLQIWEKASELIANKYRAELVAATMLGQSKTVFQAEIDAGAELVDFMRMNGEFLKELLNYQPISNDCKVVKNHMIWRGLGGFVAAISPFNFTAIGGNLACTPALMGNTVLWKPSDSAILSSWLIFKIMQEAGLPDGIINFVPSDGPLFGNTVTYSTNLSGINFTGSVPTFQTLWKLVAKQLEFYKTFPRISGECGGKNYHFVHPSADVDTVVACTVRSAFEYGGQKCSACSRLYVPDSLWQSKIKKPLCEETAHLLMGDVCDYKSFLGAVIDEKAFLRITKYIDLAKTNPQCDVLVGGRASDLRGYFIEPTIVECRDPYDIIFKDEIFGPFLSVYVYKESDLDKTLELVGSTTKYALTGSVFATDETFLKKSMEKLRSTAGNFYINDKSTGAVVGQQPFGGGKMSGTNDKPGSPFYLTRWTSALTVKETFVPQTEIYYPYMNICTT